MIENCTVKGCTIVAGVQVTGPGQKRELESGQVFTIGGRSFMFEKAICSPVEVYLYFLGCADGSEGSLDCHCC